MPRWVRFFSCSFTGLLLSLAGFFLAADFKEGGPRFWAQVMDFIPTSAFWGLVSLFALLAALSLLIARAMIAVYGLEGGLAGLLAGGLLALAYASFLVSSHAADWGGLLLSVRKAWPDALVFGAPVAFAGALTTWMWDRLD